jgi:uncharacterized protein
MTGESIARLVGRIQSMDRVFLDANVLFSLAYNPQSPLRRLCSIPDVRLLSSAYAIEEARRNLTTPEQIGELDNVLANVELVAHSLALHVEAQAAGLPSKDIPILEAAIDGAATHLLTGDKKHFGALYGQTIKGVLIQRPADYLSARATN